MNKLEPVCLHGFGLGLNRAYEYREHRLQACAPQEVTFPGLVGLLTLA